MGGRLVVPGLAKSIQGGLRRRQRQFSAITASPTLLSSLATPIEEFVEDRPIPSSSKLPPPTSTLTSSSLPTTQNETQTQQLPPRPLPSSFFSSHLNPTSEISFSSPEPVTYASDANSIAYLHYLLGTSSKANKSDSEDQYFQKRRPGLIWRSYFGLSKQERDSQPIEVHRAVLRQVVPKSGYADDVLREKYDALQVAMNHRYSPEAAAGRVIRTINTYPWSYRLQFVIRIIREKMDALDPESKIAGFGSYSDDWLFVLRRIARVGDIANVEQVIREVVSEGVELSRSVEHARVDALSRWVIIRTRVEGIITRERTNGKQAPPLVSRALLAVPHEVAALAAHILASISAEGKGSITEDVLHSLLMIAKNTQQSEMMNTVLRLGFGVDLRFPDVPPVWLENSKEKRWTIGSSAKPALEKESGIDQATVVAEEGLVGVDQQDVQIAQPLKVETLNIVLGTLGRKGDLWGMLQAYEVLGTPLDSVLTEDVADVAQLVERKTKSVLPVERKKTKTKKKSGRAVGALVNQDSPEELVEDDEPPMSLLAETQKEEVNRQRLDPLKLITAASSNRTVTTPPTNVTSQPRWNPVAYDQYLSEVPQPRQLKPLIHTWLWPEVLLLQPTTLDRIERSTFQVLINSCIAHGYRSQQESITQETSTAAQANMLSMHFLRCAVRECDARRNIFLRTWLSLQVNARSRLDRLEERGIELKDERVHRAARRWLFQQRSKIPTLAPSVADASVFTPILYDLRQDRKKHRLVNPVRQLRHDMKGQIDKLKQEWEILSGWSWGFNWEEAGATPSLTQQLLGHRSQSSAKLNSHMTQEELEAILAQVFPLLEDEKPTPGFQLDYHLKGIEATVNELEDALAKTERLLLSKQRRRYNNNWVAHQVTRSRLGLGEEYWTRVAESRRVYGVQLSN